MRLRLQGLQSRRQPLARQRLLQCHCLPRVHPVPCQQPCRRRRVQDEDRHGRRAQGLRGVHVWATIEGRGCWDDPWVSVHRSVAVVVVIGVTCSGVPPRTRDPPSLPPVVSEGPCGPYSEGQRTSTLKFSRVVPPSRAKDSGVRPVPVSSGSHTRDRYPPTPDPSLPRGGTGSVPGSSCSFTPTTVRTTRVGCE